MAFHQRLSSLMCPREHRHQGSINVTGHWPARLVHEAQFLTPSPDRNWHRDHDPAGVLQSQGEHLGIAAKRYRKERSSIKTERDPLTVQLSFASQTFECDACIARSGSGEPLCELGATLPDQLGGLT
jgi:hypothetical protein